MKCVKLLVVLIFVVIVYFLGEASGDLKIGGTRCGSKICKSQEYCSAFDNQCYPCSNICNEKTHNYDPVVCTRDCQEYIHDARYVLKGDGSSSGNEDLRAAVQRLQYLVTVTLTLLIIVIIILIIYATIKICKWKKRNNVTFSSLRKKFCSKKADSSKTGTNNGVAVGHLGGKPDLRLDMPSPGTRLSDHSPVTVTTSISRRPAEDSALDYAYDNRAMASTPSPLSKPNDSKF